MSRAVTDVYLTYVHGAVDQPTEIELVILLTVYTQIT